MTTDRIVECADDACLAQLDNVDKAVFVTFDALYCLWSCYAGEISKLGQCQWYFEINMVVLMALLTRN